MPDKITDIAEARLQRHRRQFQAEIALAGQRAAAAFLAHLEAVARNAPREVVNRRWQVVEERAVAYQEVLQTGGDALASGLDHDLREQIDGEFEAAWLEGLQADALAAAGPAAEPDAARRAALAAYRRGYAAGALMVARTAPRDPDA